MEAQRGPALLLMRQLMLPAIAGPGDSGAAAPLAGRRDSGATDHGRLPVRLVGRRLDFLTQELTREANTLCAKAASRSLTATGLALKAAIEQFREQVQNLE